MKKILPHLSLALLLAVLVGVLFPNYGIDCTFRGWPFRHIYESADSRAFLVLPFFLNVMCFLPPAAGLLALLTFIVRSHKTGSILCNRVAPVIVVLALATIGAMILSVSLARVTCYQEEYRSDQNCVTVGSTMLDIDLRGTPHTLRIPWVLDRTVVVPPFRLTVAANVDRTDHTLLLHSVTLNGAGDAGIPAIARSGTNDLAIPLHWPNGCQETTYPPNHVCAYFTSRVMIPLDFRQYTNVVLSLDMTIVEGTNRTHRTVSIPFVASSRDNNDPYWYLRWWQ